MGSNSLKIPKLRFECTGCGACCTQRGPYAHVYVNAAERSQLAAHLEMSPKVFSRRYTFVDEQGWRQLRFVHGACTFLDPVTRRCSVYTARPIQCRTYPYWPELFGPRGWTDAAKRDCEGMGRGVPAARAEVIAAIDAMAVRDRSDD